MKNLGGLSLINELTFHDEMEPTTVHLIPSNSMINNNLILTGDKAGQICLFQFGEQSKPSQEIKPQSITEITVLEHLRESANLISGKQSTPF
jgi:hypothetical protein